MEKQRCKRIGLKEKGILVANAGFGISVEGQVCPFFFFFENGGI
jgi:hypothetical protein